MANAVPVHGPKKLKDQEVEGPPKPPEVVPEVDPTVDYTGKDHPIHGQWHGRGWSKNS